MNATFGSLRGFVLLLVGVVGVLDPVALAGDEPVEAVSARVALVGMDYPDYVETIGSLTLPAHRAEVLDETDPQFLRLSLVDVEEVPYLPKGLVVYQTISTGVEMPVSVHFVVDKDENAWCFNPAIPYCSDFEMLNPWFRKARFEIKDQAEAGALARFVVEMGISTVHHPDDFLFLRLQQKFGVEFFQFLRSIEELYLQSNEGYRSEAEQKEYETMLARYQDRVKPLKIREVRKGWQLHGFTYKIMRASGELREWRVVVRRDKTVDVDMKILERGIGEVTWSWAM